MKKIHYSSYYVIWNKVVTKMPCGRSVAIPFYGTVRAYKTPAGRRFALSNAYCTPPGGNLTLDTIRIDLNKM